MKTCTKAACLTYLHALQPKPVTKEYEHRNSEFGLCRLLPPSKPATELHLETQ